jgi:hypothetical protein
MPQLQKRSLNCQSLHGAVRDRDVHCGIFRKISMDAHCIVFGMLSTWGLPHAGLEVGLLQPAHLLTCGMHPMTVVASHGSLGFDSGVGSYETLRKGRSRSSLLRSLYSDGLNPLRHVQISCVMPGASCT